MIDNIYMGPRIRFVIICKAKDLHQEIAKAWQKVGG